MVVNACLDRIRAAKEASTGASRACRCEAETVRTVPPPVPIRQTGTPATIDMFRERAAE